MDYEPTVDDVLALLPIVAHRKWHVDHIGTIVDELGHAPLVALLEEVFEEQGTVYFNDIGLAMTHACPEWLPMDVSQAVRTATVVNVQTALRERLCTVLNIP